MLPDNRKHLSILNKDSGYFEYYIYKRLSPLARFARLAR